jgi:hypothetical protein
MAGAREAAMKSASPIGSLVGTLFGLAHGYDALPAGRIAQLAGVDQLERAAAASVALITAPGGEG